MPFESTKAKLVLKNDEIERLQKISNSRTEPGCRIERSKIILLYNEGRSISSIAKQLKTNRPKVERQINKALELGAIASLDDLPRPGKPDVITAEAKTWLVSIACQKPKDLGYSYELWTTALLARHARENCIQAGHPSLKELARGTVSKILAENEIKPHKIRYYIERRDPLFDEKMANVLLVYKEVEVNRDKEDVLTAYISYDEKPGLQAIENTSPDLQPVPGKYPCVGRDYEYVRHGTLSIMTGIDLITGRVIATVEEKHRSIEFIDFLKILDREYAEKDKIKIVLDNHSAHISRETMKYLATVPNRFEFIFTPKHASWLNLIESFFGKMARTMLRGIRVKSIQELKERIIQYINEINEAPVIYKWKYKMDSLTLN